MNIRRDLENTEQYILLPQDPTDKIKKKVTAWANKWGNKGHINEDIVQYVVTIGNTHPAKCKPLIKTHKPPPYPHRLLLSGSGTPIQPLSKFVQLSIAHLTQYLPYQIMDTKDFLLKIEKINQTLSPLPRGAWFTVCDVVNYG
eukprot:TRINITY_DN59086_c0_g1_i16.p1 TRINITY_DN59086_c0_g1~~TRINITY_DN59086_c0_g1_i16.p1  ORF type:complete len:143 (-),score=13.76 TRINITY_DN59086_c0_g1_i16:581-1009(-)